MAKYLWKRSFDQNGDEHVITDENAVDWSSYAVTGAHNLLPPTTTQTINNVIFTVNSDGTITVNNKPTTGNADLNIPFIPPRDGQYIVNGALSSNLRVHAFDRITNARPYADSTKTTLNLNNAESPTDELSYYMLADHSYYITLRVIENYTASGETFKPMVRVATDTDTAFGSYAMTNRELTDAVAYSTSAFTDLVSGATADQNSLLKVGRIVVARLFLQNVTANAWTALATIPEGYRPVSFVRSVNLSKNTTYLEANSGIIQCSGALSNENAQAYMTWITA